MKQVTAAILDAVQRPAPESHKGQNGRVLIIAGSDKFHGAMLMATQAASRIVDMVAVYTTPGNRHLVDQLKSEMAAFVAVRDEDLEAAIQLADCIVIGPGMETTDSAGVEQAEETRAFVHDVIVEHKAKKWVIDASALWHIDTDCLHENCIVTPHSREFTNTFGLEPTAENTKIAAQEFGGVVVLKGHHDFISDGAEIFENTTGNPGMTKGGTGDVLAGVVGGLAATNDLLTAALAGTFLTGLAGDRLEKQVGTFFNAEDVIRSVGEVWREYM